MHDDARTPLTPIENTASAYPIFVVRRALWFALINFALGTALLILTATNLIQLIGSDGAWGIALLFVGLAGVYTWQAWTQLRDRGPLVEIGPAGLFLRGAMDQPVPWPRVWQIQAGRGLPGLSGGRIDFQVDPETYARVRLGQRFLGDVVVRRRGLANGFSVITNGLDESRGAIHAALLRFWPPDTADEDGRAR